MDKTIIGLDIGSSSTTAFLLTGSPTLPQFLNSREFVSFEIPHTKQGLEALSSLDFDLAVLEPTGNYERIITHWLDKAGKKWKKAKPYRVIALRASLNLPKSDHFDSFLLAYYGCSFHRDPSAWIIPRALDWHSHLCRRNQLTRSRRSLVNRLKHALSYECPEYPLDTKRLWNKQSSGSVLFLSGEAIRQAKRYQRIMDETIGTGVSEFTRSLAFQIAEVDRECLAIEGDLLTQLEGDRFKLYQRVFDRFDFSVPLRLWILARVYPFQRFLVNGQPVIHKRLSRRHRRPVTYNASLASFKACLGAGTIPNTSGIRGEKTVQYLRARKGREREYSITGDINCRSAFFLWAYNRIATGKLEGDPVIRRKILAYWEKKRATQNHYRATGNAYGYVLKLVFNELCKELENLTNATKEAF